MFTWILQITIISIIFIFLVHHLIEFFKSTLTIPKIKDLVDSPSQKYKNIFNQLSKQQDSSTSSSSYSTTDLLPPPPQENEMKRELKSFLKKQLNVNSSDNASDVYSMDSTYSPYA
jgi:hypothetical protein